MCTNSYSVSDSSRTVVVLELRDTENEGCTFSSNAENRRHGDMASHFRRTESSETPIREPQISFCNFPFKLVNTCLIRVNVYLMTINIYLMTVNIYPMIVNIYLMTTNIYLMTVNIYLMTVNIYQMKVNIYLMTST